MAKSAFSDENSLSGFEKWRFRRDFGLSNQIRRAAVSVMANIAEGKGRRTNKDFANFLVNAHGSAAEVQSHLYIALDLEYLNRNEFDELFRRVI